MQDNSYIRSSHRSSYRDYHREGRDTENDADYTFEEEDSGINPFDYE